MSETPVTVKRPDVTTFIKFLVNTTMFYTLDEQNYVIDTVTGEKVRIQDRPLVAYGEISGDGTAIVLNPLADAATETASSDWLYKVMGAAFSGRVRAVCNGLLAIAKSTLPQSGKKKAEDAETVTASPSLLKFVHNLGAVNDDTIKDVDAYFSKMPHPLGIYYDRVQRRAAFNAPLFDPKTRDAVLNVMKRQKSIDVLQQLLKNIFSNIPATGDLSGITASPPPETPAKLTSSMMLYATMFGYLNPLVAELLDEEQAGLMLIDLDQLYRHLDMVPHYYRIARAAVSTILPSTPQTAVAAAHQQPTVAPVTSGGFAPAPTALQPGQYAPVGGTPMMGMGGMPGMMGGMMGMAMPMMGMGGMPGMMGGMMPGMGMMNMGQPVMPGMMPGMAMGVPVAAMNPGIMPMFNTQPFVPR